MNRTIKFRAWYENKMQHNAMLNIHGNYGVFEMGKLVIAYPDVPVMQFTGLQDKNGKDIYESDILQANLSSDSITDVYWCGQEATFKVHQFPTRATDDKLWIYAWEGHCICEVIGNIYEHPELMEQS